MKVLDRDFPEYLFIDGAFFLFLGCQRAADVLRYSSLLVLLVGFPFKRKRNVQLTMDRRSSVIFMTHPIQSLSQTKRKTNDKNLVCFPNKFGEGLYFERA